MRSSSRSPLAQAFATLLLGSLLVLACNEEQGGETSNDTPQPAVSAEGQTPDKLTPRPADSTEGNTSGKDCIESKPLKPPTTGYYTLKELDELRKNIPQSPDVDTCSGNSVGGSSQGGDTCGCDGKTCQEGERCIFTLLEQGPATVSPGLKTNQCFEICTADTDCLPNEMCLPRWRDISAPFQCMKAACRSDADCCSGKCGVVMRYMSQTTGNNIYAAQCVDDLSIAGQAHPERESGPVYRTLRRGEPLKARTRRGARRRRPWR